MGPLGGSVHELGRSSALKYHYECVGSGISLCSSTVHGPTVHEQVYHMCGSLQVESLGYVYPIYWQ